MIESMSQSPSTDFFAIFVSPPLSSETNPLLQPAAALIEKGLATPYGASA